jgi:hypothetical protein
MLRLLSIGALRLRSLYDQIRGSGDQELPAVHMLYGTFPKKVGILLKMGSREDSAMQLKHVY